MSIVFKIRIAQESDFDSILKMQIDNAEYHALLDESYVFKENIEYNFSQNLTRYFSNEKCKILVAVLDEKVIGLLLGYSIGEHPIFNFSSRAFIDEIFIDKEYRKEGVGKSLINDFLRIMKVEELVLKVNVSNESAIQFWKRCGFGIDLLQMSKKRQ